MYNGIQLLPLSGGDNWARQGRHWVVEVVHVIGGLPSHLKQLGPDMKLDLLEIKGQVKKVFKIVSPSEQGAGEERAFENLLVCKPLEGMRMWKRGESCMQWLRTAAEGHRHAAAPVTLVLGETKVGSEQGL